MTAPMPTEGGFVSLTLKVVAFVEPGLLTVDGENESLLLALLENRTAVELGSRGGFVMENNSFGHYTLQREDLQLAVVETGAKAGA